MAHKLPNWIREAINSKGNPILALCKLIAGLGILIALVLGCVQLYDRFAPTLAVSYNVYFLSMGEAVDSKMVTKGSTYGTLAMPPDIEGHIFSGWFLDSSFIESVTSSTKATSYVSHYLYAKWIPITITVSFDSKGGADVKSKTIAYGSEYGNSIVIPFREGYDFDGWYTTLYPSVETKIKASSIVNMKTDHTLYAAWTPVTITISFETRGGSGVKPKTVTYDSEYGSLGSPSKEGYDFVGWYTTIYPSADTRITMSSKVKIETDHTLYAVWTAR